MVDLRRGGEKYDEGKSTSVFFSLAWVATTKDVHTAYLCDQQKKKKFDKIYNRLIKQHTLIFPSTQAALFSLSLSLFFFTEVVLRKSGHFSSFLMEQSCEPDLAVELVEDHIVVHEPNIANHPVVVVRLARLDARVACVENGTEKGDTLPDKVLARDSEAAVGA